MNQLIDEIIMSNGDVTKVLKFERVGPAGDIMDSSSLEYLVNDSEIRTDRYVLHIGECLYYVNKKGYIIDRIVPHSDTEPKFISDGKT